MDNAYKVCADIVRSLRNRGISPIVYGSVGVSMHIGLFKEPDDVDLLVDSRWLNADWLILCTIVSELGFHLSNVHEHEFINDRGEKVAFAEVDILRRDHICDPKKDLISIDCAGEKITTLNLRGFLSAYRFSQKDGYRQSQRAIKDAHVVLLIEAVMNRP